MNLPFSSEINNKALASFLIITKYKNDVENPRGGFRGVIPSKQKY